jgi:hypothetical protein
MEARPAPKCASPSAARLAWLAGSAVHPDSRLAGSAGRDRARAGAEARPRCGRAGQLLQLRPGQPSRAGEVHQHQPLQQGRGRALASLYRGQGTSNRPSAGSDRTKFCWDHRLADCAGRCRVRYCGGFCRFPTLTGVPAKVKSSGGRSRTWSPAARAITDHAAPDAPGTENAFHTFRCMRYRILGQL